MDKISNKELRLWCDVYTDLYRATAPRLPLADFIQQQLLVATGLCIAKSKIINVKPFKKIVKKSLIHEGRIIKVIRRRKTGN